MGEPTIERIAHTAASPEGANSTYVLPDAGLVVDPGPPGDSPWGTLTAGLAAAGLPVEAVETVVVTHWHADHAGLAPRLAAAADAELVLHEDDAPLGADSAGERERRLDRDARRLRAWGVPDATVAPSFPSRTRHRPESGISRESEFSRSPAGSDVSRHSGYRWKYESSVRTTPPWSQPPSSRSPRAAAASRSSSKYRAAK